MNDGSTPPPPSGAASHVPMPDSLRVEDTKVTDYLLNRSRKEGGPKAAFFRSVGFADAEIELFKSTMRDHTKANPVALTVTHTYGTKFVVDCFVEMPNGQSYCIRTVWNDHCDGQAPRLITAHPLR